jgi:hypothetical protein
MPWGWPPVKRIRGAALPLLCFLDTEAPTIELLAVESLDGLCGSRLLGKFDEGKSSWTTGTAVVGQEYLYHLPHFRKKAFKLVLRRIVTQVPDKNLGADDALLSMASLI